MTTPLRTDFDEFLYASIGEDATGMPLTLLTVLARRGVDPWEEAADLARLSREAAMQRLVSLLAAAPNRLESAADTATLATRLVAMLHRSPPPQNRPAAIPIDSTFVPRAKGANRTVYYLIGVIVLLILQWALVARQSHTAPETNSAPTSRSS